MGLDKNKIEEQIYKLKKIQENIHAILYALEENRQRMKEILDMLQADSSAVSGMWNGLIEDCTRNIYEIEHMQAKYTEYQMWLEKYLCITMQGSNYNDCVTFVMRLHDTYHTVE